MIELKGKRLLIFGIGRSGMSALRLSHREGASLSVVSAGNPRDWKNLESVLKFVSEDSCFDQDSVSGDIFKSADYIILSPGISRSHPLLEKVLTYHIPVISEIELAFRSLDNLKSPIVAITGTNGKTTTTTMIGEMVKSSGKTVFLGGNIGIPFCDYILSNKRVDYIVLELSSFQLESISVFKADISLMLNLYPNHGERYGSVDSYFDAKCNILRNMTSSDLLIYPMDQPIVSDWASKQNIRKITFLDGYLKNDITVGFFR